MRSRVRRRIRRRAAPTVRRCPCNATREGAKERMAGAGGLMIGGAKDPAEAKAEARAAQALTAAPTIHRKCAACEEEEARRSPATGVVAPGAAPARASKSAETAVSSLGPGRPLSRTERAFYEPRLGADLSPVRLHEDKAADTAARQMDASAFTLGRDIAFAGGERQRGGATLLAHELAHATEGEPEVRRTLARSATCRDHPGFASEAAALTEIEQTDARAREICTEVAAALRYSATNIQCSRGAALTPYLEWFGRPRRRGQAFHSRIGAQGANFPTLRQAIAHEMEGLARRFDTLGARFDNPIIYACPGTAPFTTGGCSTSRCDTERAFACRGSAYVTLCSAFWTEFSGESVADARNARAGILIHEAAHARLGVTDYDPGVHRRRVSTPECLAQFAMDVIWGFLPWNDQCQPIEEEVGRPLILGSMDCGPAPPEPSVRTP